MTFWDTLWFYDEGDNMLNANGAALAGLKVLDLGRMVAAPYAAAILADMGADVIKIESPGTGDLARNMLPKKNGISTYYVAFNRSKRGITLNLKRSEGKEVFKKLISKADVLIENFRPGVMSRLGFSYEEVSKINPAIIYASISGYGQEGKYADRACFDPVAQAMSGLMSVTGPKDGMAVRCGASIADVLAGQNAVIAILAALQYRRASGIGQEIDIALLDSCISALTSVNQIYFTSHKVPTHLGNCFEASAPGNSYPTGDGKSIVILAGQNSEWEKLARVLGHAEWLERPEFKTVELRVENRKQLDELISAETIKYSEQELEDKFLSAKLPAAPVLTIEQVVSDPHFRDTRNMFSNVDHPQLGSVRITNQPIKMSKTNPYIRRCSPELGEHNDSVYSELGYTNEEISAMKAAGVI